MKVIYEIEPGDDLRFELTHAHEKYTYEVIFEEMNKPDSPVFLAFVIDTWAGDKYVGVINVYLSKRGKMFVVPQFKIKSAFQERRVVVDATKFLHSNVDRDELEFIRVSVIRATQ